MLVKRVRKLLRISGRDVYSYDSSKDEERFLSRTRIHQFLQRTLGRPSGRARGRGQDAGPLRTLQLLHPHLIRAETLPVAFV